MQITIITGNVGREPELRYTPAGRAVCDFSVAVNKAWTDRQTNERHEKTTWFKVTAWAKQAEVVNQYVHKGMKVTVSGEIDCSAYLNNDGQPRATLELTANRIEWAGTSNAAEAPESEEDLPF
jgi:single-strand DNA-binding protein